MKARWIVLLCLLAVVLTAAEPPSLPVNKAGRVQYLDQTEVPGATPERLMSLARSWLAERAHQPEDISEGERPHCIMVGDSFEVPHEGMPFLVFYTLAFEVQGNRLCATVGALRIFDGSAWRPIEHYLNKDGSPRINPWLTESVDQQARALLGDLHRAVAESKPPAAKP